jgi:hypothetical protein
MKKTWIIAVAIALVGCKKEESAAPSPAASPNTPSASVPAKSENTPAKSDTVPASPATPAVPKLAAVPTPVQQPQVDRKEKARGELDRMLAEWQGGQMPKEFLDAALLFTHGGATDKLLDYKINAVIPMPPPSKNFKGTINLKVEGRPTKQVQFMLMEDDSGKWKALVAE